MEQKTLMIETAAGTEEFQIDEFGGRFYLFKLQSTMVGSKLSKKIGVAATLESAIAMAEILVAKPVLNVTIKEAGTKRQ